VGSVVEINWMVKLDTSQGVDHHDLSGHSEFCFCKKGRRLYPINIPLDLLTSEWVAVARVIVLRTEATNEFTKVHCKVLRVLSPEEREFLTAYWRETASFVAGGDVVDFSSFRIT